MNIENIKVLGENTELIQINYTDNKLKIEAKTKMRLKEELSHGLIDNKVSFTFLGYHLRSILFFPNNFNDLDKKMNTITIDGEEQNLYETLIFWSLLCNSFKQVVKLDNITIINRLNGNSQGYIKVVIKPLHKEE